jgi:hypothetical protein
MPAPIWSALKFGKRAAIRGLQNGLGACGLNLALKRDYYSPLPDLLELRRTRALWNKPSSMAGIAYDLDAMERRLAELADKWFAERASLPPHDQAREAGFGPGYPEVDALTLYAILRDVKPARYLEVGSGLSTYYSNLAAEQNEKDGRPMRIKCIEPFPYARLQSIPRVEVRAQKVQEVPLSEFQQLEAGDVLFIDSSHALKIGSDVTFLLLEVLPAINPGVVVHIHDMPFPYNIPFPPDYWIEERDWPILWNEAMAVQAFLAFNARFKIELSLPLLRHFREDSLRRLIPGYTTGIMKDHTFSSLWLRG